MTSPVSAADVAEGLRLLRGLSTGDIAKFGALLLPAALAGDAGPHTVAVLQMIGIVLAEREASI